GTGCGLLGWPCRRLLEIHGRCRGKLAGRPSLASQDAEERARKAFRLLGKSGAAFSQLGGLTRFGALSALAGWIGRRLCKAKTSAEKQHQHRHSSGCRSADCRDTGDQKRREEAGRATGQRINTEITA